MHLTLEEDNADENDATSCPLRIGDTKLTFNSAGRWSLTNGRIVTRGALLLVLLLPLAPFGSPAGSETPCETNVATDDASATSKLRLTELKLVFFCVRLRICKSTKRHKYLSILDKHTEYGIVVSI